MEILTETQEKILIEEALNRFREARIPIERSVIVEKWRKPTVVSGTEFALYTGINCVDLCWYNSAGNLHSFNDMPSKITFNSSIWINVEWHKNGEPYRKNFKFNKFIMQSHFLSNVIELELHWLNKRGELHSFNDMPALISPNGIIWYNKGNPCRKTYCLNTELPCAISKNLEMTFCKNKDDSPEHIKYPFSKKNYAHAILPGLRFYEKYVNWPIREMLTL